jgi:hypothetical protein
MQILPATTWSSMCARGTQGDLQGPRCRCSPAEARIDAHCDRGEANTCPGAFGAHGQRSVRSAALRQHCFGRVPRPDAVRDPRCKSSSSRRFTISNTAPGSAVHCKIPGNDPFPVWAALRLCTSRSADRMPCASCDSRRFPRRPI